MIRESSFWKDDLLRKGTRLEKRTTQRRWREASFALVEQEIMTGFYSVRKLIEARKLCDALTGQEVAVALHAPTGKLVTWKNWHKIDELYDLQSPKAQTKKLRFVTNQMIHSYVFHAALDKSGGLAGFYFASDHQRNKALLYVTVAEVIRLFKEVGNDYPNHIEWRKDTKTGKESMKVWNHPDEAPVLMED